MNAGRDSAIYTLRILPDDRERKQGEGKEKQKKTNGRAIFVRRLAQPAAAAAAHDVKGSCDWSERIRQCGKAAAPQRDTH